MGLDLACRIKRKDSVHLASFVVLMFYHLLYAVANIEMP